MLLMQASANQSVSADQAVILKPFIERIQDEWHLQFIKNLIYYEKLYNNTTEMAPKEYYPRLTSPPVKWAAFDGRRWVIIEDDFYHPDYLPERGWRYRVTILGDYEEGKRVIGSEAPTAQYLLPILALHRAYLTATSNTIPLLSEFSEVPTGWHLQTIGQDRLPDGKICYVIRAINNRSSLRIWLWICPSLQYRCVRVEGLLSGFSINGQPAPAYIIVEVKSWIKVSNVPMPQEVEESLYFSHPDYQKTKPVYTLAKRAILKIDYLKPLSDDKYTLIIPNSSYVSDNIHSSIYTVGQMVPIKPRPPYQLGFFVLLLICLSFLIYYLIRRQHANA